MEYIDRRIIEIGKLNEEALKEETKDDEWKKFNKVNLTLLEKVQSIKFFYLLLNYSLLYD